MVIDDYGKYDLCFAEKLIFNFCFVVVAVVSGKLFYDQIIWGLIFIPLYFPVLKMLKDGLCKRRQQRLQQEFVAFLESLAAHVSAGYSLEKAFAQVYQELNGIYMGKSYIEKELQLICRSLTINRDVSELISDFGVRSHVRSIEEFSEVISVAKKTGGNMVKIINQAKDDIRERTQVENEIKTMVSAKKLEQLIMSFMPWAIVLYIRIFNKGYMDVLYGSLFGNIFMSVCIGICFVAIIWGRKIVNIKV